MDLLLTSAGITNASIRGALERLLDKPVGECDALCIPTASHAVSPTSFRPSTRCGSG